MPKKLTLADLAKRVDKHRDAGNALVARVSQVERVAADRTARLEALEKRVFPPQAQAQLASTLDSMIRAHGWEIVADSVIRQWSRSGVAMLANKLVTELGRAK